MESSTLKTKEGYQELLNKADEAVAKAKDEAAKDPHRLGYHIMAPANWINDPNGVVQWNGEYHVFYQHHPYSSEWGPMHWGHVKSKDLVYWEHLPIALAPSEEYDRDGCFSGSAVDDDGTLTLIYTGHIFLDQKNDIVEQSQCIATSTDGIHFTKHTSNPVIEKHPEEGSGHFRDPKVWKHEDHWYMVVGTRKGDTGKVVLYKSKDLRKWDYVGVMAESNGDKGYMWECPDLFHLCGKQVLVASPQGIEAQGDSYQNVHNSVYMVGKLNYETGEYTYKSFEELDRGFDFYAPQTFEDEKGRRILIGWMDMWESTMPTQKKGWSGAMTIPRELTLLDNGRVIMTPVSELQELRTSHKQFNDLLIAEGASNVLDGLKGESLELVIELPISEFSAEEVGLKLRCSEDGKQETLVYYDKEEEKLVFDRERSGEGDGGVRHAKLHLSAEDTLKLHVFLDHSSVEVFANDGEVVMSARIYPGKHSLGIDLFTKGGSAKASSVDVWGLKDIWK
ncbi:glycoside hydrolase family 32 protein [Bacillus taeanensis]|uniref:Sucrose-6-phosphate hydrolase n=1 Tax=Bacillus taeanensis TaxID=273032 RepID=A0A366XYX8_9BACI|nr:glycoside hydrolase family 32 protein [Bacillus taeanensis]RBW70768.1 glycoside hydrolase family 32 protein [Bacillus taeanensis]